MKTNIKERIKNQQIARKCLIHGRHTDLISDSYGPRYDKTTYHYSCGCMFIIDNLYDNQGDKK